MEIISTVSAALLIIAIYVVLPALLGMVIVGFFLLRQHRVNAKLSSTELECSTDADCPPGYVCVGGHCVPATEAQIT